MILHENCLPADDSHEISCLICYFEKAENLTLMSAANYRCCFKGLVFVKCLLHYSRWNALTLFLLVSSANNFSRQFGPR